MARRRGTGDELRTSGKASGLRLCVVMLAVAVLARGPAPAAAQVPTPPRPAVAGEIAEARVAAFETQVIDWRGHPVPGLARWDFTLWVDGVETPVDYLVEVRDGQAGASSLAQLAPPGPVVTVDKAVMRDASTYYRLCFTMDRASDSRHHELRVEVARPRTAVRAPSGYFDGTPDTEIAATAEAVQSPATDADAH
jgi:hypothetical protein